SSIPTSASSLRRRGDPSRAKWARRSVRSPTASAWRGRAREPRPGGVPRIEEEHMGATHIPHGRAFEDAAVAPPVAREAATSGPHFAIADPGPLGLAGFALTTFVLSMFN